MMLNGYKWAFDQPKTVSQNRRCILMGKNLMTIGIGPVTSGNIRYRKPFSGNLASSWDSHDGLYRPQWPSHLLKLVMEWNDGLLGIPPLSEKTRFESFASSWITCFGMFSGPFSIATLNNQRVYIKFLISSVKNFRDR